jgi:hypothetical protein
MNKIHRSTNTYVDLAPAIYVYCSPRILGIRHVSTLPCSSDELNKEPCNKCAGQRQTTSMRCKDIYRDIHACKAHPATQHTKASRHIAA